MQENTQLAFAKIRELKVFIYTIRTIQDFRNVNKVRTVTAHADSKALFESAELAAVSVQSYDDTLAVS